MKNKYKVIYYFSKEDDSYISFAPELPGCFSDGKTVESSLDNLDTIIDEWVETAGELGKKVPVPMKDDYYSTNPNIFDVSKYILDKTGSISTMVLEKLNYYCLVWSLVWFNKPIFANKFQAWQKGPVCKELFEFHRGRRVISSDMFNSQHNLSDDEKHIIDLVIRVYGDENGEFLSELTHEENPWIVTREGLDDNSPCEAEISNELIRKSYLY